MRSNLAGKVGSEGKNRTRVRWGSKACGTTAIRRKGKIKMGIPQVSWNNPFKFGVKNIRRRTNTGPQCTMHICNIKSHTSKKCLKTSKTYAAKYQFFNSLRCHRINNSRVTKRFFSVAELRDWVHSVNFSSSRCNHWQERFAIRMQCDNRYHTGDCCFELKLFSRE